MAAPLEELPSFAAARSHEKASAAKGPGWRHGILVSGVGAVPSRDVMRADVAEDKTTNVLAPIEGPTAPEPCGAGERG
jgi:hypothetical protein